MSADNWTTCPRCTQAAYDEYERRCAALAQAYGAVALNEYERMQTELIALDPHLPANVDKLETFREDYEVTGADGGTVEFDYHGECTTCGLSVSVQTRRQFWPEPDPAPAAGS